jgi:hypothetical protein
MIMPSLPVYVEWPADRRFVEVFLRPYGANIVDRWLTSAAISAAEFSLLQHPEQPVAVLFNPEPVGATPRQTDEFRACVKRILARAHYENWCVAVAYPRLDAWARTDPRIRKDFETYKDGKATYSELAERFVELTRVQPFDLTELLRTNADFRGLVEFLQRHAPTEARSSVG